MHEPKPVSYTILSEKGPEKSSFEFEIEIPKEEVVNAYTHSLGHLVSHAELKGFRKGKAPAHIVEKEYGEMKMFPTLFRKLFWSDQF